MYRTWDVRGWHISLGLYWHEWTFGWFHRPRTYWLELGPLVLGVGRRGQ